MDSLTQIVLGAAVGEAVLGKKLGNRAIVWGAIGGTIPDLDVISGFFLNELDALAFHRGLTHSIVFALLASVLFASGARNWYRSGLYKRKWIKICQTALVILVLVIPGVLLVSIFNVAGIGFGTALIIAGIWIGFRMIRNYIPSDPYVEEISGLRWYIFFLLALLTHTLLDCFTTYGTQLLLPFSDKRIAWDTIHVVDPFYTFPFLLCLVVAMFFKRNSRKRSNWGKAGLIISCSYLLLTVYNKSLITNRFESKLREEGIVYSRVFTTPTFLNNVLWFCAAETEDGYVHGYFSLLDKQNATIPIIKSKGEHELIQEIRDERIVSTLRWFSNDYFLLEQTEESIWKWKDLRFGDNDFAGSGQGHFFFHFIIEKSPEGDFNMRQNRETDEEMGPIFKAFWKRLKGIEK